MTWTSGTVRWLNKWLRWSQVQASGISNWEILSPEELKVSVRETVWKRFEESGRTCQAFTLYNSTTYASNTLSAYSISLPSHMMDGLIAMIQLRICAFPTLPRLTHIMSCIGQQYRNLCPFCNCCVPESITHLLVECSCWDHYRMRLGADIPKFF